MFSNSFDTHPVTLLFLAGKIVGPTSIALRAHFYEIIKGPDLDYVPSGISEMTSFRVPSLLPDDSFDSKRLIISQTEGAKKEYCCRK